MTLRKLGQREKKKKKKRGLTSKKKKKVTRAELSVVRQREINQGGFGKHEAHKISFKLLSICMSFVVSEVTIKPWNDLARSAHSTVVL